MRVRVRVLGRDPLARVRGGLDEVIAVVAVQSYHLQGWVRVKGDPAGLG